MTSPYCLDHVILLLDTPAFESLPAWLADNFNVIEGGTHAGGSSRNKLVIFPDGSYIELINWIGKPVEFFDWAPKAPGLIDFALTTPAHLTTPDTAQTTHADVMRRLGTEDGSAGLGVALKEPLAGGRRRKDGQEVRWFVTKPSFNPGPNVPGPEAHPTGRLDAPFFCHDVTERSLRVPLDPSITEHPSGAKGVMGVDVLVPKGSLGHYAALYSSILGASPVTKSEGNSVFFKMASFVPEAMSAVAEKVGVTVREATNEEDERWLKERGVGIGGIVIHAPSAKEHRLDDSGIGSAVRISGN